MYVATPCFQKRLITRAHILLYVIIRIVYVPSPFSNGLSSLQQGSHTNWGYTGIPNANSKK